LRGQWHGFHAQNRNRFHPANQDGSEHYQYRVPVNPWIQMAPNGTVFNIFMFAAILHKVLIHG
jgi:hypothetical protein